MLYVYPDNFIVPVIFVKTFINKGTEEREENIKLEEDRLYLKKEQIKQRIEDDETEKFRDDDKKECYDKLQKKLVMDWNSEGADSQKVNDEKIISEIDNEYASSETEKI